jgi:hypothetical protein
MPLHPLAKRLSKDATVASAIVAMITTALWPATARADTQAISVQGTLASTQVTGSACPSPIGLCTAGTLTGDLEGTFFYTAASLTVLPDGITGVFLGTLVITTHSGTITEQDLTTASLVTGALTDIDTIESGTNRWEGATGVINVQGSFNFATGVGASTYAGTVYLPQNPQ